jgi:hypothetical protein
MGFGLYFFKTKKAVLEGFAWELGLTDPLGTQRPSRICRVRMLGNLEDRIRNSNYTATFTFGRGFHDFLSELLADLVLLGLKEYMKRKCLQ